jgi:formylglycine-generating enzyme
VEHQVVVSVVAGRDGTVYVPADHWGVPPFTYLGDQSVIQRAAPGAPLDDPASWSSAGDVNSTNAHHFTFVERADGTLLGVGRGHDIDGTLAQSVSADGGRTWVPGPSAFPGIHGGQRMVMLRVGGPGAPLVTCSFANAPMPVPCGAAGAATFNMTGLYCALSTDDGGSWPARRVMTDDLTATGHQAEGFDGAPFKMSWNMSEPDGYLAAAVAAGPGGAPTTTVELVSSRNHYRFNLEWLASPAPCQPEEE